MPVFDLEALRLSLPWQVIAAICVSMVGTLLLAPLARWCAHKMGVIDRPDGTRKLQAKPVALLGGVSVLAGLGITVLAAAAGGAMDDSLESIVLVSVGLSVLCAVGVVDDAFGLLPGWKLLAQVGAAIPMVVAGCAITEISLFGVHIPLGAFGFLASLLWLVACTNAINFVDGMDGLCSTVGLCIAAGVTAVACLSNADNTVICAAALAGSLAGFLFYNLPPATIYLGDAGSMLIGMTLGLLTLHVSQTGTGVTSPTVMAALMAVPLGDVVLAMLRRQLCGKRIFQPDRGHVHHRLLDRGLNVPQALLAIAAICTATAGIAVGTYYLASDLFAIGSLVLLMTVLVNRRVVGHHEWSLIRAIVGGRTAHLGMSEAPTILRIDLEHTTTLRMQTSEPSSNAGTDDHEARRRAA